MWAGGRLLLGEKAFYIFCEDVGLNVHRVVRTHGADIGVRVGEGDDGDVRDTFLPSRDGEADAVDGDGAFFRDIATLIFGDADGKPPVVAFRKQARNAADAVHVTLDEMSAERRVGGQRFFEIYEVAGFFLAEGGAAEGFAGQIGGEMVARKFDDGEEGAVYGDAVAEVDGGGEICGIGQGDAEAATVCRQFERINFFDVLGDPCKHRENILGLQNRGRKFARIYFSAAATLETILTECAPWGLRRCP